MTIIWCMVPEIWSITDRIFCHFGPFFSFLPPNNLQNQNFEKMKKKKHWRYYHFTHVYYKWQSHNVWFLRYRVRQTELFVILDHFLPFCPLTTQKIKILKNWKKTPRDIIILHKCTKNHDHIPYCSSDMPCNRFNCYFSLWAIFCPFISLTAQKIKIKKKNEKNTWRYHHFTIVHHKSSSYAVPEIWCVMDVIIFQFGPFFAFLPP